MNYNTPPIDPTDPQGTDLQIDITGDLILTPQGDIQLVSGSNNILQMIRTRLQTIPDTYIFGNDLGSQLGETIDEPYTTPNIHLIEQYVYNALSPDIRVQQINKINVIDPGDGSGTYYLNLNVSVIGYGDIDTTVQIGGGVTIV